ncbi:MAG: insulinase family protein [Nanoarchaeota archaeon]|nr:insulinase family protein [Nanoarchaeota archaeon]
MKEYRLKNNLKLIVVPKKSGTITIQATVHVGSNDEDAKVLGISHFIEHMLFEGTSKRSSKEIANTIESLGGEISAYTSHERTCFYIKVLKKHCNIALDILSDILTNPLFDTEKIEKERKIIISEVKLVTDQPRYYQWILFQNALFKNYPVKNPIFGSIKSISKIKRSDLVSYYKKYYTADNIVLSFVGNIPKIKDRINSYFRFRTKKISKINVKEPANKKSVRVEKKKINQSYAIIGYKTVKRSHKDSCVFDVIRGILGRGLSGKLFEEIRVKRALAYDVGINNETEIDYGYFAAYFSTHKKNMKKCVNITLKELKNLKNITDKELQEAKQFIEGEFILDNEDSQRMADTVGFWQLVSGCKDILNYIKNIKKVTKKDVIRIVDKYFDDNYTLVVLEQS